MDWITELLARIGAGMGTSALEAGTLGNAIGSGVLTGAGVGGLSSALTGRNVGEGIATGALTGGVTGGAIHGLQGLASPDVLAAQDAKNAEIMNRIRGAAPQVTNIPTTQGLTTYGVPDALKGPSFQGEITGGSAIPIARPLQNIPTQAPVTTNAQSVNAGTDAITGGGIKPKTSFANDVGNFAVNNPGITAMGTSLGANMLLDAATSSNSLPQQAPYSGPLSKFNWVGTTPTYDPLKFKRQGVYQFAAGGITDLDGFGSQAQNTPTPGTLNVPNMNEVADPEGYGGESARLMAQGGIASFAPGGITDLEKYKDLTSNNKNLQADYRPLNFDKLLDSGAVRVTHQGLDNGAYNPDPKAGFSLVSGYNDAVQGDNTTGTRQWKNNPAMYGVVKNMMQSSPENIGAHKYLQIIQSAKDLGLKDDDIYLPRSTETGMARGGIADLGGYAKGGIPNLLEGPGDGVSDDIKATIADKQPARLASGEYVVPSRIVSELGNGSTDAGAKRLDMMVQKVNAGRAKTLGGKKYAKDTHAYKHLPV